MDCLKADIKKKSLDSANPKAMELSHTAVRAKIQKANPKKCYKCGSMPHPKHECPANDAKCHYCGENGYGQCVCFAGKAVCGMEEDKSFLCSDICHNSKTSLSNWTLEWISLLCYRLFLKNFFIFFYKAK